MEYCTGYSSTVYMCTTTQRARKSNFNRSENKVDGLVAERNHLLQVGDALSHFDVEQTTKPGCDACGV